jgi:ribonucleoside-diphosphate reductase alpha chain
MEPQIQIADSNVQTQMCVVKRDGTAEPVDVNKIVRAVTRSATGLPSVDTLRVALKTIGGLYDRATTQELDELSIRTASSLIVEEPEYSKLAARLLSVYIDKEVTGQDISSFSQSVSIGHQLGLISDRLVKFVDQSKRKYNMNIVPERTAEFEYFGLRTLYDRYLLRHPETRKVIETPQHFFMRIACALAKSTAEALEFYRLFSTLSYLPSSPTLFNAGTCHEQLSSCFLLDSPQDSLQSIYDSYAAVAQLSKFSGGIGISYTRVRSRGSLIASTNGYSNGVIPWLKTLDASVAAVNQCFAPDTLVFTADGVKELKDIAVGDLVLGQRGSYREVLDCLSYPQSGPMVEVDVKHSVRPLRVTSGHPFWAIQGIPLEQGLDRTMSQLQRGLHKILWVEAGDLKKGDYVAQVIPTETVPVEAFTEDDARLYGILLGDGHMSKDGLEYGVTGNPSDAHMDFVRGYLTKIDVHFWETRVANLTCRQIRWASGRGVQRSTENGQFVCAGSPTLPFTYRDLYDENKYKRISRRFSHLPPAQTRALIHGLLETDGCVSRGAEITFTNTSRSLVEGLRYQLVRLGVPCSGQYRERDQNHSFISGNGELTSVQGVSKTYDLRIPAVPEIAELVGCVPVIKRNWFQLNGCLWTRVRSVGVIVPLPVVYDLKVDGDETYMTSAALVHNGGKRKGACAVYLESWHADILEFLELRDGTGDPSRRTPNLHLANWIPDLFMQRVEEDLGWSLFDPKRVPHLTDLWGTEFDAAYVIAEMDGLALKTVKARDLYTRMLRTLAETGNGWFTFKDKSNRACNQTYKGGTVHLSNLCTEILEVTSNDTTAVCNLGSINLSRHLSAGAFDFEALGRTVRSAIRQLDRVIDLNFYPVEKAKTSNRRWRPVGLGFMGLQDVFFSLRLPFDSPEALSLSTKISEEIYYHALSASADLAEELGQHPAFSETRTSQGELQFDAWGVTPSDPARWSALSQRIQKVGLRNSLLIAIAPTATIASIAGCCECLEPQVSNLFKRETLSGEFLQVNAYLAFDLKRLGLWTEDIRDRIKAADGSVHDIAEIPNDLRVLYRTAWELSQRSLIDLAAARGPYIDQSQSLNLFMENPDIGRASSMYMYAWKSGLKTTYYLRSRPATRIAKTTTIPPKNGNGHSGGNGHTNGHGGNGHIADVEPSVLSCSIENAYSGSCEACQ